MVKWISEHSWLFGGAAVSVPIAIIGWIVSASMARLSRAGVRQSQKSGRSSTNFQAGGDISLWKSDVRKGDEEGPATTRR